jgi:hypothetical protein
MTMQYTPPTPPRSTTAHAVHNPAPQATQARLLLLLHATLEDAFAARGGFGSVVPMGVARKFTDSCDKYLVRDGRGRPIAVLSLSPPDRPHATDVAASRTREAQAALGQRLGRAVLMPWHTGTVNGASFSVAPYHRPVSTFGPQRAIERRRLLRQAGPWLQETLRHTVSAPDDQELQSEFQVPLATLVGLDSLAPAIRQRASLELRALEAGDWQPRLTLAHYDLWQDNFLWAPDDNEFGFVVIDWGGSRARGHAVYDLLRLALSSPANVGATLSQLRCHCRILECAPEHAAGHALAALGHLAMNLGDWPVDRLAMQAQSCFDLLGTLEQRFRARRRVPAQALRTHDWGLTDPVAGALQRLDLADYDALMHADVGPPFKTKPGLAVHQLLDPQTGLPLFLKRCTGAPSEPLWRLAARRWLRRRPLHTEPYHVHLASQTLRAHGFNAMPVLAWGERRLLGWLPDQGFMLASGVSGDSLEGVFAAGTAQVRQRVMCLLGLLMGRLHHHGFCVTLRLHDLLVPAQELQARTWRSVDPAMIDLDFKGHLLHATGFEQEAAIRATAHSAYLLLRTGLRFEAGEGAAWLRAYRQQLRSAGITLPRQLAARLRRKLQIELAQHHRDSRLVAMFPGTPQPAAGTHAKAHRP